MAKTKISEYSSTSAGANLNTDINTIDIDEGCAPSGINNAIRTLMAQLKDFQTGVSGDGLTLGGALSGTSATFSGNVTASAISGASMTLSGDLTVDTNTLYVDSTNNRVGIGTSSPSELLEIGSEATSNNYIQVSAANNTASGIKFRSDNSKTSGWDIGYEGNGNYLFFKNDVTGSVTERMRIDSSGNVGIGTTSPTYRLQVQSGAGTILAGADSGTTTLTNATQKVMRFGVPHYTNAEEPVCGLFVSNESTASTVLIGGGTGQFNAATSLQFYTAANNTTTTGTERMRIDSSGNVGIGTSSPTVKFQVAGGDSILCPDGNVAGFGGTVANAIYKASGTEALVFRSNSAERMRITSTGNVGIGTSSPGEILHLNATTAPALRIESSAGSCYVVNRSSDSGMELLNAMNGPMEFYTNNSERMRIDSSGNVLVGTTAGTDFKTRIERTGNQGILRLQNNDTSGLNYDQSQIVIGQAAGTGYMFARYYTSAGGAAQFAFRGDGQMFATSTSISSISDIRTKENIRDSNDGLSTILNLRTVRFDFKEGFGNNRKNQLGFIAQEVESVFPDAVDIATQNDNNGDFYKTVAPGTLIPVLVKAIQEQQDIIKALETRIQTLENK